MCSDRRGGSVKPLIYTHPRSGLDTLCFHVGMIDSFIWDQGTPNARTTDREETDRILDEIEAAFTVSAPKLGLIYSHRWLPGDFIMSDNAAVAHEASEKTQASVQQVGLRILHRTTIQGTEPPIKKYKIDAAGHRVHQQ